MKASVRLRISPSAVFSATNNKPIICRRRTARRSASRPHRCKQTWALGRQRLRRAAAEQQKSRLLLRLHYFDLLWLFLVQLIVKQIRNRFTS